MVTLSIKNGRPIVTVQKAVESEMLSFLKKNSASASMRAWLRDYHVKLTLKEECSAVVLSKTLGEEEIAFDALHQNIKVLMIDFYSFIKNLMKEEEKSAKEKIYLHIEMTEDGFSVMGTMDPIFATIALVTLINENKKSSSPAKAKESANR